MPGECGVGNPVTFDIEAKAFAAQAAAVAERDVEVELHALLHSRPHCFRAVCTSATPAMTIPLQRMSIMLGTTPATSQASVNAIGGTM